MTAQCLPRIEEFLLCPGIENVGKCCVTSILPIVKCLGIIKMSTDRVDFWLGAAALVISCMPWWITLMPLLLTFSDDILKNTVLYRSKCLMYVLCYTLCRFIQLSSAFIAKDVSDVNRIELGVLWISLCLFHIAEYLFTAYFAPNSVSLKAFRFLVKWPHLLVASIAGAEFFLKTLLPWDLRSLQSILFFVGLGLVVVGESWMMKARIDAGANFIPMPRLSWEGEQELVTDGIYRLCRHPWYFGWSVWTVGLWLLVSNPLTLFCAFLINAIALHSKIDVEELALKQTFEDYRTYSATTRRFPRGFNWIIGGNQP